MEQGIILLLRTDATASHSHIGTGWPKDGEKHHHFELDFFCGRIHQFPDRFDMFKYF